MKLNRLATLALAMPNVLASNLRQSKSTKVRQTFDSKAGEQHYATPSAAETTIGYNSKDDAKATQPPCGVLWHRSLDLLNPNACTNDGRLPLDSSMLYSTVEGKLFRTFTRLLYLGNTVSISL